MNKKAVSPVVATALLIAITIVLAAIIFIWARGFLQEGAEKQGRAVELSCDQLVFAASLTQVGADTFLDVTNRGNVPIYGFTLQVIETGSITPYSLPDSGVLAGNSKSIRLSDPSYSSLRSGLVLPVLLAEEGNGNKVSFPCPDVNAIRVDL